MTGAARGAFLALAGALVLAPDTLLMRWSELGGLDMVAWRGVLMAAAMLGVWALFSRKTGDIGRLLTWAGAGAVAAQAINAWLFATGIAVAPVSVVLFSIASVPLISALLGAALLKELPTRATVLTFAVVLGGIALSLSDGAHGGGGSPLTGVFCGLGVAFCLAASFTIYRANPDLPVLLSVGCGAGLSGLTALFVLGGLSVSWPGTLAIAATGLVVLPVSFFALSIASRHVQAATVSLFLLLETVLGPLLVWAGTGEAVGPRGLAGGAIVVVALAIYLSIQRREMRRDSAM